MNVVGRPAPRIDAVQRVTGAATYTGDVRLPGMLHARVLRSPHPHARIRRINTTRAAALPGVKGIITHENCRVSWSSGDSRNTRYLFNNPVRFVGDPVAAVAAVNAHVAAEALALIDVQYERLPFVLDPGDALKPDAAVDSPWGKPVSGRRRQHEPEVYRRGNIEAGLRASDLVFEDRYTSAHVNNAQLEPRVSLAAWTGDKLTVYASTQGISNCRTDLAKDLGIPVDDVRVVCEYMGGGFGNKNQCHDFDLMAAVLAKAASHPCGSNSPARRTTSASTGAGRRVSTTRSASAVTASSRRFELRGYSGMGGYRKGSGAIAGTELYRCPHVRDHGLSRLHEHRSRRELPRARLPAGSVRARFDDGRHRPESADGSAGVPTAEHHAGVPRRAALYQLRPGGLHPPRGRGLRLEDTVAAPRRPTGGVRRGAGMAIGSFHARVGAQQRHHPPRRVGPVYRPCRSHRRRLRREDDDGDNRRRGTRRAARPGGDRQRRHRSVPVFDRRVRQPHHQLHRLRGDRSGSRSRSGRSRRRALPTGDAVLVGDRDTEPTIEGAARYSFAAHFVEVEVDAELGRLRSSKYVAVHDSGRIVNPLTAASQVKGGVTMGIGMALHEQLLYDPRTGISAQCRLLRCARHDPPRRAGSRSAVRRNRATPTGPTAPSRSVSRQSFRRWQPSPTPSSMPLDDGSRICRSSRERILEVLA